MKFKNIFFILTQISCLMFLSNQPAHAFMGKCKGPVAVSVSKTDCSSCHIGKPRKSNYNGTCDVMRSRTRHAGMSNIMPVMGVSMDMFSRDRFDDDNRSFKRREKHSDYKAKRENKNEKEDRSSDDHDDD